VTLFVLKSVKTLSEAELSQFAKLYPHNAMPVQPLSDRVVQESK
jgi:carbonic anhydrase